MRPGIVVGVAAALPGAALALAGCALTARAGAESQQAVAPAPASFFLSPAGSDRNTCAAESPCLTIGRAYERARPGQIVELADGTYPAQTIRPRAVAREGTGRVVVRAALGARPHVGRLSILPGVSALEVVGIDFPQGWLAGEDDSGPPATNIVFRRTTGRLFAVMNVSGLRVVGGSYGPSLDTKPQIKVYNPGNAYVPTDVVVEGVLFHDFTRSSRGVHTECLQVYAGQRITIRNNRFTNCDGTGALALTTLASTRLQDVLVENNWFDAKGDALYAIQADESVQNLLFRYNSAAEAMAFTDCGSRPACGPAHVVGNHMPWNPSLCTDNVTYSYNVLVGGRCGRTDVVVPQLGFVDVAGFDFHLVPGAAAVCRGDAANFPARDIDGQRRPRRYRPDAGADHRPKSTNPARVLKRCVLRRR